MTWRSGIAVARIDGGGRQPGNRRLTCNSARHAARILAGLPRREVVVAKDRRASGRWRRCRTAPRRRARGPPTRQTWRSPRMRGCRRSRRRWQRRAASAMPASASARVATIATSSTMPLLAMPCDERSRSASCAPVPDDVAQRQRPFRACGSGSRRLRSRGDRSFEAARDTRSCRRARSRRAPSGSRGLACDRCGRCAR